MTEQQPEAQSSNMAQAEPTSYGKPPLRVSYKVPFSLRLRYTITSIVHFFRIMKQPQQNYAEIPEFLSIKNGEQVGSYCTSLCMLYIDPKTTHLSRDRWQVVDIKTYKDNGSKYKHEYLIATLSDGGIGKVLLRIDRRIQASSVKKMGKAIIAGLSPSQPVPPNHSDPGKQDTAQPIEPEQKSFQKTAMDDVTLVKPNVVNRKKQNLVEHIVFEDAKRVSLPQFIVLASAINAHATYYDFFESNCYWFRYIIVELLKTLSKPSFPPLRARGRQGTWLGLPTGHLYQGVKFDVVSARYTAMWKEFENKVCSITEDSDKTDKCGSWQIEQSINRPDNRYVKEEKKRADDAEHRAEESDKRAEEERRRAEEERRRAEQLERQLAELKAQLAQSKGKGPNDVISR